MRISKFSPSWFGLGAGVIVGAWAGPAAADQCSEDSDCPKGFTCEVSTAVACPEVACVDGEKCEEAPDCGSEEVHQCVSIDCSADSDCADDMVCETVTTEECSGSGGGAATPDDPGSDGEADPPPDGADPAPQPEPVPPADESCVTEERNYCVPRYLLPCEAASDCGSGFTCETRDTCACTSPGVGSGTPDGDGSTPPDDADLPLPPDAEGEADDAEDDCGCEAQDSSVGYCELEVTACAVNADCPAGFACQDNPEGSCSNTPDGGETCVSDPEKICMPPYEDLFGGIGIEEDGSSGGEEEPTRGEDPTGPADPDPPATDDVDTDAEADGNSDGSSASGGGCAVGSGSALPSSTWASLVLMLGAAAMRRRRRA